MTEESEWNRYPSGISSTPQEAMNAAAGKAHMASRAFKVPLMHLSFQWIQFGTRILWRIIPTPRRRH